MQAYERPEHSNIDLTDIAGIVHIVCGVLVTQACRFSSNPCRLFAK